MGPIPKKLSVIRRRRISTNSHQSSGKKYYRKKGNISMLSVVLRMEGKPQIAMIMLFKNIGRAKNKRGKRGLVRRVLRGRGIIRRQKGIGRLG
jgi:hypothetical protein